MFKPVSLFIGLRYIRTKKRSYFISFISFMSILGIALGVCALITVLSVMNGFNREIQSQVFSMVSPITITTENYQVANWKLLEKQLSSYAEITAIAPFVAGQVLLSHNNIVYPAILNGINPIAEKKLTKLAEKMIAGSLVDLNNKKFSLILGADLAGRLQAFVGDNITVIAPQFSTSVLGVTPRFKRFVVSGIFKAGSGFGFDGGLAYTDLLSSQKLFQKNKSVSGLHLQIVNPYNAHVFSEKLASDLPDNIHITNWTQQFGEFFHAIALQKTIMFFVLMLIIAVAAFNLVCTLVMGVTEKRADIAILRTLGATPGVILRIFLVQGATAGIFGTLLGVAGGILLSKHITSIVSWIESILHIELISSSVYFDLTRLPSKLEINDVVIVSFVALVLSFLATIYPAWQAAKIQPAEALRYE